MSWPNAAFGSVFLLVIGTIAISVVGLIAGWRRRLPPSRDVSGYDA